MLPNEEATGGGDATAAAEPRLLETGDGVVETPAILPTLENPPDSNTPPLEYEESFRAENTYTIGHDDLANATGKCTGTTATKEQTTTNDTTTITTRVKPELVTEEESFLAEKHVLAPLPDVTNNSTPFTNSPVESSGKTEEVFHLLTMPLDSLHQIASFLTPVEWLGFARTSKTANSAFREIIRRVRLHGFKCAAEIISAWKLGYHSDARELAALYVQSGVPVYPHSLGYSYQTLLWRMQVEVREMTTTTNANSNQGETVNEAVKDMVDPFYRDRASFRITEDYAADTLTYVEEKCLFWEAQRANSNSNGTHGPSRSPQTPTRSSPLRDTSGTITGRAQSRSPSPPFFETESGTSMGGGNRLLVRVHQHLWDQHAQKRSCVNDSEGLMVTPRFSLSADFYDPNNMTHTGQRRASLVDLQSIPENTQSTETPTEHVPAPLQADLHVLNPNNVIDDDDNFFAQELGLSERRLPPRTERIQRALQSCEIHTYIASLDSTNSTTDNDGSHELRKLIRSKYLTYHRKLESLIARMDHSGFEECLMDFWDEFFTCTAYIQYHDSHTAVPRVSCLHKFLTRPCPKAIGIVQCEIERIKITSRGKGVSMKGRLFPTYEYRLFIRHRSHNQAPESAVDAQEEEGFERRDTVLMVAKNRGRKHTEISGVASTKKGANNYFLYMPQQMDVDAHYNKVNSLPETSKMNANGASLDPVILSEESSSVLMGRLQSNFIGTEFQIFSPRSKKHGSGKSDPVVVKPAYSPSDDEVDYDDSYSNDAKSTRRSRQSRFRLGSSQQMESSEMCSSRTRARSVPRSISSTDAPRRPNRRAIANAEGLSGQSSITEEEDGVITYTANLLGSRPRIMDVCIPAVGPDGNAGTEWHQYLESLEEDEEGRMLSCFRQLLQRLENLDPQQPRVDGGAGAQEPHHRNLEDGNPVDGGGSADNFGLLALQNRPPWWNVELGSFVLNFGGRVSVASVKNFQLCDRSDQDNIMLQFGRIHHGRHSFTMDFQYPLTAVQAFSISISSLQSKISFG
jgi:hypothetical protein